MGDMNTSREALTALQQKYSGGMPDVYRLSDEQKAWLELKIQTLAEGLQPPQPAMKLHKIRTGLHMQRKIFTIRNCKRWFHLYLTIWKR